MKSRFTAFLALALVCVIGLSFLPSSPLTSAPGWNAKIDFVSPEWVAKNIDDTKLKVLDVRTAPLDYIASHLPIKREHLVFS